MFQISFNTLRHFAASVTIILFLITSFPVPVIAQDALEGDGGTQTEAGDSGSDTESGGDGESTETGSDGEEGNQNESGDAGDDGTGDGIDGEDGDTVEVSTENDVGDEGTEGDGGEGGTEGDEGNDGEDMTGGQTATGTDSTTINTGDATSEGEITTDANNNKVSSELSATSTDEDLDTYTVTATGTNETTVDNQATTTAGTGENTASSTNGDATINTGDAVSVLNIANIINSNIINSNGFIHLLNKLAEAGQSLDLRNLFSMNGTSAAPICSLVSCAAEDIQYVIDQTNKGEITNDALIEALSGANTAEGETATVTTGDAYGSANVLNVANTNIIDSNYLLLALNLLGSLDGDLILPAAEALLAFFSQPNGLSQLEDIEDFTFINENTNNATTTTDINATAESGLNTATTTDPNTLIQTGASNAESNILNEINKNLIGGDSMYVLIRVHGSWSGTVYGLPSGLTWTQTPEGILIYNEDAEIEPSQIVAYDVDSYTANFTNQNDIVIDNNIDIHATSGENAIEAEQGSIATGEAYAGANVMNIANTNVIGRNWVMATMNIFGDLNGDISFGSADLWIGGKVQSSDSPIGPGSKLTYTYKITNNGDLKVSDVDFMQELSSAYTYYTEDGEEVRGNTRRESLGTILPGQTIEVTYDAYVNDDLPYGTTDVEAIAEVTSDEPEDNDEDNMETLAIVAERQAPSSGGGGGSRGSSDRGRVLGAKVDRTTNEVDPNAPPALSIEKTSNFAERESIEAGRVVSYQITVSNDGGRAYDATLADTLVNPIGSIINEQSWELGTIAAGEEIELSYEIRYDTNTPTGEYTNTAKLVAYGTEGDPSSLLEVSPATHTLSINGQDLAIGNVQVLGVFENGSGSSAALVTWETTKPSDGQIFLSPKSAVSPYNPNTLNYGYERASVYFPFKTTKHFMLVPGLQNGTEYVYRIRSGNGTSVAMGGDYTFRTPGTAPAPVAQTPPAPQPQVVAAQTSAPAPKPTQSSNMTFASRTPEPEPEPEPKPVQQEQSEPTPQPQNTATSGIGSVVNTVVNKVFGFFGG